MARNVARLSPTVSFASKERDRLTAEETVAFLVAARADKLLGAAVVVMMTLGLRPGEATGFLWEDIDLDDRTAHLRRSRLNRPDPVTGRKVLTLGPTKTRQPSGLSGCPRSRCGNCDATKLPRTSDASPLDRTGVTSTAWSREPGHSRRADPGR